MALNHKAFRSTSLSKTALMCCLSLSVHKPAGSIEFNSAIWVYSLLPDIQARGQKYLKSTIIFRDSNTRNLKFGTGKGIFDRNICLEKEKIQFKLRTLIILPALDT